MNNINDNNNGINKIHITPEIVNVKPARKRNKNENGRPVYYTACNNEHQPYMYAYYTRYCLLFVVLLVLPLLQLAVVEFAHT